VFVTWLFAEGGGERGEGDEIAEAADAAAQQLA
jgi:hypothetical protein